MIGMRVLPPVTGAIMIGIGVICVMLYTHRTQRTPHLVLQCKLSSNQVFLN